KAQIAAQASSSATATATATAVPTQATATAPPPPPPPPPPPESGGHTILPWIVTSVGAAAAITGGIIYLVESSAANAAKAKCQDGNVGKCTPIPTTTETVGAIGHDYTAANNLVPVGS